MSETMRRILFVDDESDVLEGLQRMLWDMEDEWDMAFSQDGKEALSLFEQNPFEVIVTDMRMPRMDGAQLLEAVQQKYPQTVRIILSGHSDRELAMRSVKTAHQFLAKPSSPERVKSAVSGALELVDLVQSPSIRHVLASIDSLPSMPSLYTQVCAELDRADASLKRVGRIISQDAGMTTYILKIVNSAFFGLTRNVSSPEQAVTLLGTDLVRGLVLGREIFSSFDVNRFPGVSFKKLWQHCLKVGIMSKAIAEEEGAPREIRDRCFIGGLLHDIGKLLLAEFFPEKYASILEALRERSKPFWVAELETLMVTHAEIGAYLVGLWGQPGSVVQAVAKHHEPGTVHQPEFSPLVAVHVANAMEHSLLTISPEHAERDLDMRFIEQMGMADRVNKWQNVCRRIAGGEDDE